MADASCADSVVGRADERADQALNGKRSQPGEHRDNLLVGQLAAAIRLPDRLHEDLGEPLGGGGGVLLDDRSGVAHDVVRDGEIEQLYRVSESRGRCPVVGALAVECAELHQIVDHLLADVPAEPTVEFGAVDGLELVGQPRCEDGRLHAIGRRGRVVGNPGQHALDRGEGVSVLLEAADEVEPHPVPAVVVGHAPTSGGRREQPLSCVEPDGAYRHARTRSKLIDRQFGPVLAS